MKQAIQAIHCFLAMIGEIIAWAASVYNAVQALIGPESNTTEHLLWAIFWVIFSIKFQLTVHRIFGIWKDEVR